MKKLLQKLYVIFVTILILGLVSCQQEGIMNLTIAKNEVKAYYKDGHHGKETYDVIEKAIDDLSDVSITSNAMIIFDVDETALSNYEHIASIDFGWAKELWTEWLLSAKAKNIPQVKKLYDYAIENNITVAFVTGRHDNTYEATLQNLRNEGYTKFDTLICRGSKESKMSALLYKGEKRKVLTDKGFNIIMSVGDQWSDLEGDYSGIKVKIPNYLYEVN